MEQVDLIVYGVLVKASRAKVFVESARTTRAPRARAGGHKRGSVGVQAVPAWAVRVQVCYEVRAV